MIESIHQSFQRHPERTAFYIKNTAYTYKELENRVVAIQQALLYAMPEKPERIGVVTNDDLDTYASILAVFFLGRTFIPLNLQLPEDRIKSIVDQAEIDIILTSDEHKVLGQLDCPKIKADSLNEAAARIRIEPADLLNNAYIFFTSGSTGIPKGVPVAYRCLDAFMKSFFKLGYKVNEEDRFLQMFDLTFDLSLMSYLVPLSIGASVYTIPAGGIKYHQIARLLIEKKLTFALMVPSILMHLRPFFEEIMLKDLRYSLFCGEALHADLAAEWSQCVPNARVDNVYGPTEATIFCYYYTCNPQDISSFNGVASIGKAMPGVYGILADENNKEIRDDRKGELCLSGDQVIDHYWKNPEKDKEVFFQQENRKYYKTGDLCYRNDDGDLMYCGRVDHQVQIQGYRVELGEIEYCAREFLKSKHVAALAYESEAGTAIHLFIEKTEVDLAALKAHLYQKLPAYMAPARITELPSFPTNKNDKVDRTRLKSLIHENQH